MNMPEETDNVGISTRPIKVKQSKHQCPAHGPAEYVGVISKNDYKASLGS